MKKLFYLIVAIAILGLIVPGCIPVVPPSEQGDLSTLTKAISTWYVDGALGTNDGTHGTATGSSAFKTIQFAINDSRVQNNDTIIVAAGTYPEEITISKAFLTLQSETELGAIIRPTNSGTNAIYISADGVTIDGFEIDGTTLCKNGILGWETNSLTIKNNKIHGATNVWDGCGILLFSWGNGGTVYNNLIENNEVYDTGRMGIMVMDYGTTYSVTFGNTITGNIVYDVWKEAWGDGGGGIQINVGKDCTITNNEVYGVQNGQRGIYMFGSAAGNIINGNTLTNNEIGIQLWISGEGGTTIEWGGEVPTSPQVHDNDIYDNNLWGAKSTNLEGTAPMVMDATRNWWGSPTGPHRELPNGKWVGKGDKVSSNIDYKPWSPHPVEFCNNLSLTCTTIQDGILLTSEGKVITTGYDEWGYDYQAHMFNGGYCDAYRDAAWCQPYKDIQLIMKWNDAWLSNKDCDGDGLLDRHYGYDTYIGSGAWLTNHQWGSYIADDGKNCNWDYFVKIVAAPADATLDGDIWYTANGTEIGPAIWGAFAIIQQVENDPCADIHGVQYLSPAGPGFGQYGPE